MYNMLSILQTPKNSYDGINKETNQLYKNSIILILTRSINAGCGFLFWMLAARIYSIEDVGVAAAIISSASLVILLSRFGFDISLIRFLPIYNKNEIFSTCLTITTISSLFIGFIYILEIGFFSPSLSFIQEPTFFILFLIFVTMNSVVLTLGNTFLAIRASGHYLLQNLFLALRIPLLIPLAYLASFGIFASVGLAYLTAFIFGSITINKIINIRIGVDKNFIKKNSRFLIGNYISSVLSAAPTLILPIMVINLLGEADSAKYFIAFSIGNLVLMIPDAISTSLFIEGSHGRNLRKNAFRAGKMILLVLSPAVLALHFFGFFLLRLIGKDYLDAFALLQTFAFSSFLVGVYSLFLPIQNVRMKINNVVKLNLLWFALLLGLSYIFINKFGILGVGYAWIITYFILCTYIIAYVIKNKWI